MHSPGTSVGTNEAKPIAVVRAVAVQGKKTLRTPRRTSEKVGISGCCCRRWRYSL